MGYVAPELAAGFHLAERGSDEQGFESARVEATGVDEVRRLRGELSEAGFRVEPTERELRELSPPMEVAVVWGRVAPV
ncbi:hypothetical protein FNQ90_23340, partial [Streptomyces alkaliphilus]